MNVDNETRSSGGERSLHLHVREVTRSGLLILADSERFGPYLW